MIYLLDTVGLFLLALGFMGPAWELALPLIALVILSYYTDRSNERFSRGPHPEFLALPFAGIQLTLLFGAIFNRQPQFAFLADVGIGITILLAVLTCAIFWRAWITCLSLVLFLYPFGFYCLAVANMSITHTWL